MSSDTIRLGVRRVLRVEDSKGLKVVDKNLVVVQIWDCGARVVLPLHFDSPSVVVNNEIDNDRYYLTLYGDELVYLHEAVPIT